MWCKKCRPNVLTPEECMELYNVFSAVRPVLFQIHIDSISEDGLRHKDKPSTASSTQTLYRIE